ncbi:MAG: hypothetical protein PHO02_03135 [Candidatus Nanoarchaeia archaeon]|nr:hypothetical protein [Candidatus Nanoarchaeia archaeon]
MNKITKGLVALALAAGIGCNQTNEQKPAEQQLPVIGHMELIWLADGPLPYGSFPYQSCTEKYYNHFNDVVFCKESDGTIELFIDNNSFCERMGCSMIGEVRRQK